MHFFIYEYFHLLQLHLNVLHVRVFDYNKE